MKQQSTSIGSLLCIASLAFILSGCAYETDVAGDAGANTGAAVHGQKIVSSFKPFKSHATSISEGNRDLNRHDFMGRCVPRCENEHQAGANAKFCDNYCECTYELMRTQVPVLHLRDFGLGQTTPSQDKINRIVGQCAMASKIQQKQAPRPMLEPAANPETNTKSDSHNRG